VTYRCASEFSSSPLFHLRFGWYWAGEFGSINGMPGSTNAFEPRQVALELLAGATSGTLSLSSHLFIFLSFCGRAFRCSTSLGEQVQRAQSSDSRWTLFECDFRRKERVFRSPLLLPRRLPL
jgi:hypothetical protein